MAGAIIARQLGDEYQQLVFWKYALMMMSEKYEIGNIRYEDNTVKSYDDVVIEYSEPQIFRDSTISKEYIQVKFHMRDDNLFTIDNLLDPSFINAESNSLLDNVVVAYKNLGTEEFQNCVFVVYSMWDIDQNDALYKLISNEDSTIEIERLFDGTTDRSKMGRIRKKMCKSLGVEVEELKCILKQIRIMSRKEKLDDLITNLNLQLEIQGLRTISGSKYTNPYVQLIQNLYKSGHVVFTKDFLEKQLYKEGLYSPKKEISLIAIRSFMKHAENLETKAEHILRLENYFAGRFLKEQYQWEDTIYPILDGFFEEKCQGDREYCILFETTPTIAFMAGRILDIKAGKKINPVQRTENGVVVWDKKDNHKSYPKATCTDKVLNSKNVDVAFVIGVSRDIYNDVEEYLFVEKKEIGRIIDFRLETTDSANVLDGMHAWILANQIKNEIDKRVLKEKQGTLHVFFACPNSMVFILGRYSFSFGKVQLYEYDFEKQKTCTYYPTITLPVKEEL